MDLGGICAVVGTGLSLAGFIYAVMWNFKKDVNDKFEKHERRFELLDQRLFLLCMGKDLPSILKAERQEKRDGSS